MNDKDPECRFTDNTQFYIVLCKEIIHVQHFWGTLRDKAIFFTSKQTLMFLSKAIYNYIKVFIMYLS